MFCSCYLIVAMKPARFFNISKRNDNSKEPKSTVSQPVVVPAASCRFLWALSYFTAPTRSFTACRRLVEFTDGVMQQWLHTQMEECCLIKAAESRNDAFLLGEVNQEGMQRRYQQICVQVQKTPPNTLCFVGQSVKKLIKNQVAASHL